MAYTKYSLTPANNNATPPDGAPEGMLPSAVNDTMRDMMAQIRDCGDGIRDGTYTMTAPKITGGTITGAAFTGNTFTSPVISGGSINNTPIGASTANTGAFTTLSASGATTFSGAVVMSSTLSANGGATLGDASGDALTINSSAVSIPNGLNFDSNTLVIDATNNRVGVATASPTVALDVTGAVKASGLITASGATSGFVTDATNGYALFTGDPGSYNLARSGVSVVLKSGGGVVLQSGTSAIVAFQTNGANERMRIDSSGNVGIGTSSPSTLLTVGDGAAATRRIITLNGGANAGIGALIDLQLGGTSAGYLATSNWAASDTSSDIVLHANASRGIRFYTNATERMRLDSSGNLGLGVTPSAWASGRVLELGALGNALWGGSGYTSLTQNAYLASGSVYTYARTASAARFDVENNTFKWHVAGSGTAGNAITFTQAMTLDSSGNLGIGTTSPGAKLGVSDNSSAMGQINPASTAVNWNSVNSTNTATVSAIYNAIQHIWRYSGTEAARIDTNGRLLVGLNTANASGCNFQVSSGVTFPATQSASSDANTLDDYEEGTWTPTVTGGYTGVTYSIQTGVYTKVGRLVQLTCYVQFSGTSNSTAIVVSGLPFAPNTSNSGNGGTVTYWDVTTDGNLSTWCSTSTTMQFYKIGRSSSATSSGNVSGKYITFSMTYWV